MTGNDLLFLLGQRIIAFNPVFVDVTGSVTAALMLSQAVYWQNRCEGGWFYKTQNEWQAEIRLTRTEQESARRRLRELGILQEERRGVPAQLYYRVDAEALQTRLQESCNLECGKPANKHAGTLQPNKEAEITTEITAESLETPSEFLLSSAATALSSLPPVTVLPLIGGKVHAVTEDELAMWEQAYPAVDVRAELRRILPWLHANPDKQSRSVKGSRQRVVKWLGREQDKGGRNATYQRNQTGSGYQRTLDSEREQQHGIVGAFARLMSPGAR